MRFSIVTLGCKVNMYESQYYAKELKKLGWEEDDTHYDVMIINSCAVTNTAAGKSRKMLHRAQKQNPEAFIVLVGCYAQVADAHEKDQLQADLIVGAKHKKELVSLILEGLKNRKPNDSIEEISQSFAFESMPIERFESKHRAFLKVQDGCNQFCAYCIIPYARGRERSLGHEEVIQIAKNLAKKQHLEIVLTGIHTGRYHDGKFDLAQLLKALLQETSAEIKYRISSIEITEVSDELIELMKKEDRLLHHLHIPIQSGSDATLKRMNRPYTVEEFKERIDWIRQEIPDISISTDVICGFKQESEEEFQETLRNLETIQFSFLHVFPYSIRKGTAAEKMAGDINGIIVKQRTDQLLALSEKLRLKDMERFDQLEILIETDKNGILHGYTNQYHPVIIKNGQHQKGRICTPFSKIENNVYVIE